MMGNNQNLFFSPEEKGRACSQILPNCFIAIAPSTQLILFLSIKDTLNFINFSLLTSPVYVILLLSHIPAYLF